MKHSAETRKKALEDVKRGTLTLEEASLKYDVSEKRLLEWIREDNMITIGDTTINPPLVPTKFHDEIELFSYYIIYSLFGLDSDFTKASFSCCDLSIQQIKKIGRKIEKSGEIIYRNKHESIVAQYPKLLDEIKSLKSELKKCRKTIDDYSLACDIAYGKNHEGKHVRGLSSPYEKERLLRAFEEGKEAGISDEIMCKALGTARRTIYSWRNSDDNVDKRMMRDSSHKCIVPSEEQIHDYFNDSPKSYLSKALQEKHAAKAALADTNPYSLASVIESASLDHTDFDEYIDSDYENASSHNAPYIDENEGVIIQDHAALVELASNTKDDEALLKPQSIKHNQPSAHAESSDEFDFSVLNEVDLFFDDSFFVEQNHQMTQPPKTSRVKTNSSKSKAKATAKPKSKASPKTSVKTNTKTSAKSNAKTSAKTSAKDHAKSNDKVKVKAKAKAAKPTSEKLQSSKGKGVVSKTKSANAKS